MLSKCMLYTQLKKRNWQGLKEGILSYHQAPCIKICFWIFLLIVFLFLSHYFVVTAKKKKFHFLCLLVRI